MKPPHDSGGGRLPLVPVVILATLVVAIGALGVGPRTAGGFGLSDPALRGVRILGGLLALGGIGVLIHYRRRMTRRRNDPEPAWQALLAAAGIMTVLGITWYRGPRLDILGLSGLGGLFSGMGERGPLDGRVPMADGGAPGSGEAGVSFGAQLAEAIGAVPLWLLVAILAGVGFWLVLMRRTGERVDESARGEGFDLSIDHEVALAGLEAAAHRLEAGAGAETPRNQVAAAYRELLVALERAGVPRWAHEAPHEHLRRALELLGLAPDPLHRLADLYVRAEFGNRPVSEADRRAAVRALEEGLGPLRSAPGSRA